MAMPVAGAFHASTLKNVNGAAANAAQDAGELQNHFMTMLVTQLKNQSPLNPMDSAQMTTQLAQINTVSGIEKLNRTLATINGQIDTGQALQAAALVGHGVLVPGDRILVGEDSAATPFGFDLDAPADQVEMNILDGSGQVVRHFELGPQVSGEHSFGWDGLLEDGSPAPSGSYHVSIQAKSGDEDVTVTGLNYALVTGIRRGDSGIVLDLGGIADPVTFDQVRQIL